eukprot:753743-Hanusia_phi.AAC.2
MVQEEFEERKTEKAKGLRERGGEGGGGGGGVTQVESRLTRCRDRKLHGRCSLPSSDPPD